MLKLDVAQVHAQTICKNGDIYYSLNGKMHREHGPAIVYANGSERWMRNGFLHRENGPATILNDGYKDWYRFGRLHRTDGPAVECPDGRREYWVNGFYCIDTLMFQERLKAFLISGVLES